MTEQTLLQLLDNLQLRFVVVVAVAAALRGIKEVGGITIAQKLETARQPEMPESAIASGCIDFVLSPEDIAQEIVRVAHDDFAPVPA